MLNKDLLIGLSSTAVRLSAQTIASSVEATRSQITYWSEAGYLKKKKTGYHKLPVYVIPKAYLMSILVNDIKLEVQAASEIADRMLKHIDTHFNEVELIMQLLAKLHSDCAFDKLIKSLEEINLTL